MVFGFFACIADALDFRVCPGRVAPRWFLPRLGCEGAPDASCLGCLSSDFGGVWPFRIHWR